MVWAIGDIQSCFDSFKKLLSKIEFDTKRDRLWLAGDLVNRGFKSREVLEYLYEIRDSVEIVLGNHDIAMILAWLGLKKPSESIKPVLDDKRCDEWMKWLISKGFVCADFEMGWVMTHAGIAPIFDLRDVFYYNEVLKSRLKSKNVKEWFEKVREKEEIVKFEGDELNKERYALASFISMRFCKEDGSLDFVHKYAPSKELEKEGFYPWFECPKRKEIELKVVFGHWSTLGYIEKNGVVCLDTGCVWNRKLTAKRLDGEGVVSIKCKDGIDIIK